MQNKLCVSIYISLVRDKYPKAGNPSLTKHWHLCFYVPYTRIEMTFSEILNTPLTPHKGIADKLHEIKQVRMIEGIIDGKVASVAARDAGFGPVDARTPYKLIPPEQLRAKFQEIAEKKGLTLGRIVDKIEQHLEARANQTLNGKEVTVSDAPDNRVQQKAIDQLTGLLGMQDAKQAANSTSSVTLSISGPAADRLAALLSGE